MKKELLYLNILHIFNDGYQASYLLLLPFIAKDLNINLTQVGTLGSVMYLFDVILSLPSAYISSRFGGFKTLLLSLSFFTTAFLLTTFTPSYAFLLITFTIAGLGFGLFHPTAFALIAHWSTKETRGTEMGKFTAIGDVGRIGITTLLTFMISFIGWKLTSGVYGIAAGIIFLVVYISHIKNKETYIHQKSNQPVRMKDLLVNKRFILASVAGTLDNFASSSLFLFIPFLLLHKGISPSILGLLTGAFFVGNFLGKTFLGKSVDRFGNVKVFIIAEICMAIFIFVLTNVNSLFLIIPVSIILGALTKGTAPVRMTLLSESVEHHGSFEKAFGLSILLGSIGAALAPVLLGYASDNFGIDYAFYISAFFALAAVIPIIGYSFIKNQTAV